MATSSRNSSLSSPVAAGRIRKRVSRACDLCRLKKSKCDGLNPCTRCETNNAICVFGKRKKLKHKIYPTGYVEILEQQRDQLTEALRVMYSRSLNNKGWDGTPLLKNSDGHPRTHDILERLEILHKTDTRARSELSERSFSRSSEQPFENDPEPQTQGREMTPGFQPANDPQQSSLPTATTMAEKFLKLNHTAPTLSGLGVFSTASQSSPVENDTSTSLSFLSGSTNVDSPTRNEWSHNTSGMSEAALIAPSFGPQFALPQASQERLGLQLGCDRQQYFGFDGIQNLLYNCDVYGTDMAILYEASGPYLHATY